MVYRIARNIGGSYIWRIRYFLLFSKDWRILIWRSAPLKLMGRLHVTVLAEFNLAVFPFNRQTAKLNSPPIFRAIRYICHVEMRVIIILSVL